MFASVFDQTCTSPGCHSCLGTLGFVCNHPGFNCCKPKESCTSGHQLRVRGCRCSKMGALISVHVTSIQLPTFTWKSKCLIWVCMPVASKTLHAQISEKRCWSPWMFHSASAVSHFIKAASTRRHRPHLTSLPMTPKTLIKSLTFSSSGYLSVHVTWVPQHWRSINVPSCHGNPPLPDLALRGCGQKGLSESNPQGQLQSAMGP